MILNAETKNILSRYFETQPVLKAFLFGSFARGEANASSDIDILVELDHTKPVGLKFVSMQLELQDLLQSKVDLVSSNGVSKYILPIIESEMQLLYARK